MEQPKSALDHYEHGRVLKHVQMFDQAREEFQHAASDPQYAGNESTFSGEVSKRIP